MSWSIVRNADKTWSITSDGTLIGPFTTWAEASKEALLRAQADEQDQRNARRQDDSARQPGEPQKPGS